MGRNNYLKKGRVWLKKQTNMGGVQFIALHTIINISRYICYYKMIKLLQTLLTKIEDDSSSFGSESRACQSNWTVEWILSLTPECYELVDNSGWNFFIMQWAVIVFFLFFYDLKTLLKNLSASSLINEEDAKENSIWLGRLKPLNRQNVSVRHILKYGYP